MMNIILLIIILIFIKSITIPLIENSVYDIIYSASYSTRIILLSANTPVTDFTDTNWSFFENMGNIEEDNNYYTFLLSLKLSFLSPIYKNNYSSTLKTIKNNLKGNVIWWWITLILHMEYLLNLFGIYYLTI